MAGWKRKQPEQISCFWSQALWYLAAALIEPLKFLSPHAGSAGWLTKHFFLRQKLCLFSPLCESVTLCRSWSICLMNRRWISLSCRECCIEAGVQLVDWNVSQVGRCYLNVGGCSHFMSYGIEKFWCKTHWHFFLVCKYYNWGKVTVTSQPT